ncbi:PilC/PilY family type IV pilus protein [Pseudomonas songnenensis]|uniref:Pilus assembly protein PilY n=1 Tax=Pseudomonas songnenensis TaxID=1176259 RepID=A0ABX9V1X6_9PSED|nr:PilC/PilY family type IV pilus protein [Pseudomonas songnenensis]MCQ4301122.1 PilC/PilY family type IV pilus protein [Pseudomonas songnenensis]RMH99748.1 pilus assembly protein PilY [Pseudomonas songnenensis]
MKTYFNRFLLALAASLAQAASAEDIDLFVGVPSSSTGAPNVLIILDNTANWNDAFSNEMAALRSVVSALPEDKFRLGIMMFTETGGNNSGPDGAYVRAALRPMDAANKTAMANLVTSFDKLGDKSNGGKVSKAMQEAYLYFAGATPHAGNNKAKTDFAGNRGVSTASDAVYALPNNALASKDATSYRSPIVSGCGKNYIIYISNGPAQDNSSDITQATTALAGLGGSTTTIPITPSDSQDNVADEWARFMKKSGEQITTYTIDINRTTNRQGLGWTALLQSMARTSDGKYFDVTSTGNQIVDALNAIFSEVQATNSVFASVSLPVSVNAQGTYLNQVFIGMFRPDADGFPRWYGNLKQYKLGYIGSDLRLLDADGVSAINSNTGFITECARSFWTPTAADSYWSFSARGNCLTGADSSGSNSPDGNIVEKGGQGYLLRASSTRNMLTCGTAGGCTSLTSFSTANNGISATALGATNETERTALINWARGVDLKDENGNGNVSEMRPSVHGDVVHSRPVAINYGTAGNPNVVAFYGGNDGALRAVVGNRTSALGTHAAGSELWSFMPPEFYGKIKRLYDNNVPISFPGYSGTSTPKPKDYGMDGPVVAYQDESSAWIYATMRRGGRAVYAFNVNTPASPSLKWKRGCPNNFDANGGVVDTSCSDGFSGIGQTWAPPKLLKASGYGSGTAPMLIMGGGYDTCEDGDPHTCTDATKGNKVYVLDADSGELLRTFDTQRSVVSDVTLVRNSAGQALYGYLADLGGNVYRITMGASAPLQWTMTRIAALGCDTAGTCTRNRKFMFAPDIVADGADYVLMLGSGDREKPLLDYDDAAATTNYFFMLRDRPSDSTWLTSEASNCGGNLLCMNSLLGVTTQSAPTTTSLGQKKGWYLQLDATEQVVTSAITVFGDVTFSTHQPRVPTTGVCSGLGETRVYTVNYLTGQGVYHDVVGDGLPPSPVAGMVTLDDGVTTVPFVIGADPSSPLQGSPPINPASVMQPTSRVFWNVEQ